jgi:putative transposase
MHLHPPEDIYRGKYLIPSARHKKHDYASPASYFITINTKYRIHHFGHIENGTMCLSSMGQIVHDNWELIGILHPHIYVDTYIIMPDHLHGILTIRYRPDDPPHNNPITAPDQSSSPSHRKDVAVQRLYRQRLYRQRLYRQRLYNGNHPTMSTISPRAHAIPTIIRSYKSACTRSINKRYPYAHFAWQPRYYDHIIRTPAAHARIRRYILNNPTAWNR